MTENSSIDSRPHYRFLCVLDCPHTIELHVVGLVELYAHAQEIGSLGKLTENITGACVCIVFIFDAFSRDAYDRRPH